MLGYTNVDGKGISGLELGLEEELAAGEGPVRLTLDSGVQFALEAELAAAALEYEAIGAAGVVLDAQGGDLLGLASWPPVDPNRPQAADTETKASRASGRVFELGSVFKPFTIAAGLDSGVISPADTFDARETVRIGPKSFRDKYHRIRSATVTDVLANSSNVGTVKVGLRLGAGRQQAFLEALGLFDRVDLPLPENERPLLPGDWTELTTATVSFGHGMSVTPLAFATAFGTFANGGEMPVLRIRADRAPADTNAMPTRVIAAPTAAMVVAMMRETVTRGTGRSADIPGYRVAGKTGTAEKPIPGGYDAERQVTSFAAVFPADDPRYVVFIVLDEPKTADGINEAAAYNAAPTAGRVVERIAPLLDVMPRFEDLPSRRDLDLRQVSDRRAL